jgi:hypothetical protein
MEVDEWKMMIGSRWKGGDGRKEGDGRNRECT